MKPANDSTYPARRTKCMPVTRHDVMRDSLIAVILIGALAIGLSERVVVKNDSIWVAVAGFAIGAAVQIALAPIADLVRFICQLWFTYHVTMEQLSAEKILAVWTALYSFSFRGIDDMARGIHPIVLTLLACLVVEAIIVGAIGNLYTIEPTLTVRAVGTWPLLGKSMNAAFDANQANDVSQGSMFGAICSPTHQAGTMTTDPTVTCNSDHTFCQASVSGALHPLISDSFGIPYELGFTKVDPEDLASGRVTGAQVKISCNSTAQFFLAKEPDPPQWAEAQVQVNVSLPSTSGYTVVTIPDGITYQTPGLPEIGILPIEGTDTGSFLSLLFAKDFEQDLRGFQQFKDPVYGRNLGLTDISIGTAAVETQITYTTPALATHATIVEIVEPLTKIDIPANNALLSALSALSFWLSCFYWYCPRIPVIPTFDRLCLQLKQPPSLSEFDWDGQMAKTMQGFAKSTMMQFAAFALVTTAEHRNITAPVTVRTKTQYSRLVISAPCTGILLVGIIASTCLVTLRILADYVGRRYPALDHGLNITDSVYSLLSAFQSRFVNASGVIRTASDHMPDSDPTRVRVCLLGKQLTLNDASFQHSVARMHAPPESGPGVAEDGLVESGQAGKLSDTPVVAQRSARISHISEDDEIL
ncbi:hypothetical protein HDU86_001432 [Geranomyces michiganensis]|nr:hypothetical protein HDU86_001432 [Geranomyces michiganensis]